MKFLLICILVASVQAVPFRNFVRLYGGGRVVGGQIAMPGQFPYQLSLRDRSFGLDFHFCGASIYDADTMITAAHCVHGEDYDNPTNLEVVAGIVALSDTAGEQRRGVKGIIIHEDYDPVSIENDIALLKVDSSLDFNDSLVEAIPVPDYKEKFSGYCTVSGWGTLSYGGTSPDVLHYVEVPVLSDDSCRDSYGTSNIADSMICAGEEGKGSCQGDSGGPMACEGLLAGIVSSRHGCGFAGYPGVYTEVADFIIWINANV